MEADYQKDQPNVSDSLLSKSMPIFENGRFKNPWPTWRDLELYSTLKFGLSRNERNIPSEQSELERVLPVMNPDLAEFDTSPRKGIRHMWVGHATSLVQMDGVRFMTDPIFSCRCSFSNKIGRQRYRPPPCSIDDLPSLDFIVISHNHYDHLDYKTVVALNERFGSKLRWYVPMGLKSWMNSCRCDNVVEMTWWQQQLHSPESGVQVVCTPCQHWCKRTLFDDNKVLWCSWSVIGPVHKFFFAGDTGYCDGFKEIGDHHGPFHLATIPIGAYKPRDFLAPQHVSPKEAVEIHHDIKSAQSIGIHWGTFPQGKEFYLAPRDELKEEVEKRGMSYSSFVTVPHGEVTVFGSVDIDDNVSEQHENK